MVAEDGDLRGLRFCTAAGLEKGYGKEQKDGCLFHIVLVLGLG
jgi:hypothetical protein